MRKDFKQDLGEKFMEMLETQDPMRWINMTSESSPIEIIPGVPSIGKTSIITRSVSIEQPSLTIGLEMTQETLLSRFDLAQILDEE